MPKNQKQKQISLRPASCPWSTTNSKSCTKGEQSMTKKSNYYNKQGGSYGKTTSKETCSSGAFGRGGHKDEFKVTNTCKVGNSKGYTEHTIEEKVRTVKYDNTTNKNDNNKKKNPIIVIYYDSD